MAKAYLYRREDNQEIVKVPFLAMIDQDAAGYITLADGVVARRCLHLELERDRKKDNKAKGPRIQEIVSDALGFTDCQFEEFERDRKANGFTDIEFRRDPSEPRFFQVQCDSWRARDRYMRHRGFYDRSNGSGVRLTQRDLDRAAELVGRNRA